MNVEHVLIIVHLLLLFPLPSLSLLHLSITCLPLSPSSYPNLSPLRGWLPGFRAICLLGGPVADTAGNFLSSPFNILECTVLVLGYGLNLRLREQVVNATHFCVLNAGLQLLSAKMNGIKQWSKSRRTFHSRRMPMHSGEALSLFPPSSIHFLPSFFLLLPQIQMKCLEMRRSIRRADTLSPPHGAFLVEGQQSERERRFCFLKLAGGHKRMHAKGVALIAKDVFVFT